MRIQVSYLSPFTASTEEKQREILEKAGMYTSPVIGMHLEWSGPVFPTKKKKTAQVYDASLLVLSTRMGTILYHLFQYQDPNNGGLIWPGPYLTKTRLPNGKWKSLKTGRAKHGIKWLMPQPLKEVFARNDVTFTGKSTRKMVTRLNNVFQPPDKPIHLDVLDVTTLLKFTKSGDAKPKGSLGDILKSATGWSLKDKTRTRALKSGWNKWGQIEQIKQDYSAMDGVASYILGVMLRNARFEKRREAQTKKQRKKETKLQTGSWVRVSAKDADEYMEGFVVRPARGIRENVWLHGIVASSCRNAYNVFVKALNVDCIFTEKQLVVTDPADRGSTFYFVEHTEMQHPKALYCIKSISFLDTPLPPNYFKNLASARARYGYEIPFQHWYDEDDHAFDSAFSDIGMADSASACNTQEKKNPDVSRKTTTTVSDTSGSADSASACKPMGPADSVSACTPMGPADSASACTPMGPSLRIQRLPATSKRKKNTVRPEPVKRLRTPSVRLKRQKMRTSYSGNEVHKHPRADNTHQCPVCGMILHEIKELKNLSFECPCCTISLYMSGVGLKVVPEDRERIQLERPTVESLGKGDPVTARRGLSGTAKEGWLWKENENRFKRRCGDRLVCSVQFDLKGEDREEIYAVGPHDRPNVWVRSEGMDLQRAQRRAGLFKVHMEITRGARLRVQQAYKKGRDFVHGQLFNQRIRLHDLNSLLPKTWLNDEVILYYLLLLQQKFHGQLACFTSFFYNKLTRREMQSQDLTYTADEKHVHDVDLCDDTGDATVAAVTPEDSQLEMEKLENCYDKGYVAGVAAAAMPVDTLKEMNLLDEGDTLTSAFKDGYFASLGFVKKLDTEVKEEVGNVKKKSAEVKDRIDLEDGSSVPYVYSNVQTWTRHIDIFTKRLVIFPINVRDMHWVMVALRICDDLTHEKTEDTDEDKFHVIFLDSLGDRGTKYIRVIDAYTQDEWCDKMPADHTIRRYAPQPDVKSVFQTNGYDCGVWLCANAWCLAHEIRLDIFQEVATDTNFFRQHIVLSILQGEIHELIEYLE